VAQVIGFIKGKSAIQSGPSVQRAEKEFCGTAFLGARVLGVDGGQGRNGDPGLHSEPGARRPAIGPDEPVALTGHRKVAPNPRAALATRLAALSGSQAKAPGSAGGYLHTYELRAEDSLQLAAALTWCQQRPARRDFATAAGFFVIDIA